MQGCSPPFNLIPQIPRHHYISENVEIFQSSAQTAFDSKPEQIFIKGNGSLLKKIVLTVILYHQHNDGVLLWYAFWTNIPRLLK